MALSIGELVGYVTLNTSGVKAGAAQTESTMAALGSSMSRSGVMAANGWVQGADGKLRDSQGKFVSAGEQAAAGLAGGVTAKKGLVGKAFDHAFSILAIGAAGKAVIGLEADFGQTMAQIGAAVDGAGGHMDAMRALAMKLGRDTAFSASDAANAMLDLGKAGVNAGDIMGGALSGTLTLAAAGGLDLGNAATVAANAMNTFGLKGKDMNSIAAALAGGANASTASVESLGQALQQVGPGATNAGLSLQETVAALSAFDNAGIKGSDAGTSLKTMLSYLVPQTDRAAAAMQSVGLYTEKTGSVFVNANGSFKSLTQIAGILHTKLSGLSEAQRQTALTQIFGSDASRAATVLMKDGAKGINTYIKATKDQGAALAMAKARMSGTAGAIERMKGSIETAGLALGQLLAPMTRKTATAIGAMANSAAKAAVFLSKHKDVAMTLGIVIGVLTAATMAHSAAMAVEAAGGMTQWLLKTNLITAATKTWTALQWLLNVAMSANPIMLTVLAIAALVAAFVIAYKKSDTFRAIVTGAFDAVKNGISAAINFVLSFLRNHWPLIIAILAGPIGLAVYAVAKNWDKIKAGASNVVEWIKGIPGKIGALGGKFGAAGRNLLQGFIDGMKNAAGVISGIAGNVWDAVKGLLNGAIRKINSALEFKIHLPLGKSLNINPPDIPQLATGGRATAATLAVIGEGREPESVLPDSVLRGLLERAHAAGAASGGNGGGGRNAPLIGTVVQREDQSANELAEQLWFLTQTRG